MNPELEQRLRAVYYKGYLELIDPAQCDFSHLDPLEATLRACLPEAGAGVNRFMVWSQLERVASMPIGLQAADGRFWKTRSAESASLYARLAETGQPGFVGTLLVSTVYPAWDLYFNLWTPREDMTGESQRQGHLNCALVNESPPAPWDTLLKVIGECCTAHGLVRLSETDMQEDVPFVTASMWASEEERELLDLNENDFTPAPNQQVCNVARCLFQQH